MRARICEVFALSCRIGGIHDDVVATGFTTRTSLSWLGFLIKVGFTMKIVVTGFTTRTSLSCLGYLRRVGFTMKIFFIGFTMRTFLLCVGSDLRSVLRWGTVSVISPWWHLCIVLVFWIPRYCMGHFLCFVLSLDLIKYSLACLACCQRICGLVTCVQNNEETDWGLFLAPM